MIKRCVACGAPTMFPVWHRDEPYHVHCAPERPKRGWIPGQDTRAEWVKRLDRNAKVLA